MHRHVSYHGSDRIFLVWQNFEPYCSIQHIVPSILVYSFLGHLKNPAKEVHHKKILNLEKGITLDPVWAEFNETFREIMSRKM